jgi:hypothetical protein
VNLTDFSIGSINCVRKRKYKLPSSNQSILPYLYPWTYQNRKNSWKPECVLSFNMDWRQHISRSTKKQNGYRKQNVIFRVILFIYIYSIMKTHAFVCITYTIYVHCRKLFIFALAEYVAHNLCCQIRADDNSSTCTFTTRRSVTCTGARVVDCSRNISRFQKLSTVQI